MVNLMLTKQMKIQHGIRASFLQNNLNTGRKIVRFTTLLRFATAVCCCSDLNLVNLVEQPIGGRLDWFFPRSARPSLAHLLVVSNYKLVKVEISSCSCGCFVPVVIAMPVAVAIAVVSRNCSRQLPVVVVSRQMQLPAAQTLRLEDKLDGATIYEVCTCICLKLYH